MRGAFSGLFLLPAVADLNVSTQTRSWGFACCSFTCCPALTVVTRQLRHSHPGPWPRQPAGLNPLSHWRLSFDSRGDPLTPERPGGGLNYLPVISDLLSGLFVFTGWPRVSALSPFSLPLLQACAHRWKNVYYDSEHILPHGYCSIIPPSLQGRTKALIPCYEGIVKVDSYSSPTPHPVMSVAQLRVALHPVPAPGEPSWKGLGHWLAPHGM